MGCTTTKAGDSIEPISVDIVRGNTNKSNNNPLLTVSNKHTNANQNILPRNANSLAVITLKPSDQSKKEKPNNSDSLYRNKISRSSMIH